MYFRYILDTVSAFKYFVNQLLTLKYFFRYCTFGIAAAAIALGAIILYKGYQMTKHV